MMRGTFANIRLENLMVPGVEGGFTVHLPDGEKTTIFEASERYQKEHVPLIVIAGKEYGTGSSRDWAAKGTHTARRTRGDRRELRAHPSQQPDRDGRAGARIQAGSESRVVGVNRAGSFFDRRAESRDQAASDAQGARGIKRQDEGVRGDARVDTPEEVEYVRHGGILPFVLRDLLRA